MNKYFKNAVALLMVVALMISCGNSESPESVVTKWCELNVIEHSAKTDEEKVSALAAREAYEKEVDEKYIRDNEFYTAVIEGMKACEEQLQNVSDGTTTP
jgi:hypothetical protein